MVDVNKLTLVDAIADGDSVPVWSNSIGGIARAVPAAFAAYIATNASIGDGKVTQYAAPSASGFSIAVGNNIANGASIWLVITPIADYAAGTIILPLVSTCVDKQELLVNITHAVTALSFNANGANTSGLPTSLVVGDRFRLRFEGVTDTWYRV